MLSDSNTTRFAIGPENLRYELGKHVGYPVINGEERIHPCNNIMSIQANDEIVKRLFSMILSGSRIK